jgi:hypothetical protein
MKTNVLYYGDNLDILRHHIPDESIDLMKYPRLQIITVLDVLKAQTYPGAAARSPRHPPRRSAPSKRRCCRRGKPLCLDS